MDKSAKGNKKNTKVTKPVQKQQKQQQQNQKDSKQVNKKQQKLQEKQSKQVNKQESKPTNQKKGSVDLQKTENKGQNRKNSVESQNKEQTQKSNNIKRKLSTESQKSYEQQKKEQQDLINAQSKDQEDFDRYEQSESDDTDDEIINAKIGKIPWKWYENYKHFGYDSDLKKITKPAQKDFVDQIIQRAEDPNWYRTITDELNQKDIVLSDEQLFIIKRLLAGKMASKNIAETDYSVQYEYNDPMPLDQGYQPKRRFQPSKWERMMVNKMVDGIKRGTIVLDKDKEESESEEEVFDLWEKNEDDEITKKFMPISAPKMALPGNAESYNPPEEYLFDKKELKAWKEADPEDRETNFVPKKYDCLRHMEFYENLVNERFERCLDLYLCPRAKKKKLDIDPESLIPKLPKPEELRPYPTTLQIQYIGHKSRIRSISVSNSGQYLASLDEKGEIIVWEVSTSRKMWNYKVEQIGYNVEFTGKNMLCVTADTKLYIFNIKKFMTKEQYKQNEETIVESESNNKIEYNQTIKWEYVKQEENVKDQGLRIIIHMNDQLKGLAIHHQGDYISTVAPMAEKKNESVLVHSITKGFSQKPFNKTKGIVEKVLFHHKKPVLFILTRRHCFVYNLQKQATVKKLLTGAQWNSSIALHPYGDNLIIGTYDKKVLWFDLDLQTTPYKNLRYHEKAVRNVQYHKKYPLMASCSDDGSINILHAKVHTDMMENALILPVKMLKGHTIRNDLGVLDIVFHPQQPWIFSAGADHRIFLWT